MSAESLNIITIEFPDPSHLKIPNGHFNTVSFNESFYFPVQGNIRTLSSKGVERGDDPYGLLYVPDLHTAECRNLEKQYVAENTTRLRNVPSTSGYSMIAVAPWFSPTCMDEYFASARVQSVKAIVVYKPGSETDIPPQTNDATWAMGDGGAWQYKNQFPTYAIPGASGALIIHQLSLYSGNVSSTPFGDSLELKYESTDFVRLWGKIFTTPDSQLPSLWVFLVIVLALLIVIIGATSSCMHFVQRRRRRALRDRVIRGEVDLEALGVKRLTVPGEYVTKLPSYVFLEEPVEGGKPTTESSLRDTETELKAVSSSRLSSAPETVSEASPTTRTSAVFSQSTCPICLDDFEHNESQVRELPCRHIFHVDCIDPFLLNNSSLCPICKRSVLPQGCCPAKITNIMVRRERIIRRQRARNELSQNPSPGNIVARLPGAYDSLRSRVSGSFIGRRIFSTSTRTAPRPSDIELGPGTANTSPVVTIPAVTATPEILPVLEPAHQNPAVACSGRALSSHVNPQQHQEWTRNEPLDSADENQSRSKWKRGMHAIFPGFR